MVDIKRYNRIKGAGLSWLVRSERGVEIHFKRFDPETGRELSAEVQLIVPEELLKKRTELWADAGAIDAMLAEVKALLLDSGG